VYPLERIRAIAAVARRHRLELFVDGARLWNASAATGTPPSAYVADATLVSVCMSKGLGAPAGSVVCGSKDHVREARRLRVRLGGQMRQAGVLAAAGLYALDHHLDRLGEDHANARRLADALAAIPGVTIVFPVETNLVFAALAGRTAAEVSARLAAEGVLANPEGTRPDVLRFLTHLDVSRDDIDEAVQRIARALR
jgi:threonine aldolase